LLCDGPALLVPISRFPENVQLAAKLLCHPSDTRPTAATLCPQCEESQIIRMFTKLIQGELCNLLEFVEPES
jgi:hypothetical protein